MNHPARRAELFAVEAEEFLADLELLTGARELEDAERLVRGARNLRGAAMFAGFGTYARAAASLETLARQLRAATLDWDPVTREEISGAVAALRGMLPRGTGWDAAADREALSLAERLERFAGGGAGRMAQNAPAALTTGVRAFIARESALIAGSLERAARALSPLPPAEALAAVLERMRSLRGLGASADLSPLPEMLDAMEIATRMLLGDDPPPPDVAEVFDEAARALAAMAREIADTGRVVAPPELDRVALHLLSAYAEERDVILIEELAPAGESSIVQMGTAPSAEMMPVPIEMVGVGDHLLLMADTLARPALPVVRDLRLFVLHRTLATMPPRSATAQFLQPLIGAVNGAIAHRIAGRQLERFIVMLRDCGRFLIDSGSSQNIVTLRQERDRLVQVLLRGELGSTLAASRHHTPVAEVTVDRVEDVREEVEEIVSIASLAPAAAPVEAALPLVVHDVTDDDASLADFQWDIIPMEAIVPDADLMRREREAAARGESPDDHVGRIVRSPAIDISPLDLAPVMEMAPAPVEGEVEMPAAAVVVATPDPVVPPAPVEAVPVEPVAVQSPVVAATDEDDVVSISVLLMDDVGDLDDLIGTPIVPIEALMRDADRPPLQGAIPRLAPGAPTRLEAAMRRQRQLESAPQHEPASLDGLIGQEVVAIDSMLYRGPAALARAAELHAGIASRLKDPALSVAEIRDELEELLDLVALARDAA